ncbi:MAG: hypothetical protein U0903_15445 [Planctomycetales bacterium]
MGAGGEGVPTRKIDALLHDRDGKLYKRQEFAGATDSADFEEVNFDQETGKRIGWRPVGDGPEDQWFREGFANLEQKVDGTYELVGPKSQGNRRNMRLTCLCRTIARLQLRI